jgi:hypothetical protein
MTFTFDTYKAFIAQYDKLLTERDWLARGRKLLPPELKRQLYLELPATYRAQLPLYTLAICPCCGAAVTEPIDTFSLMGLGWWFDEPAGFGWFGRKWFDENYLRPAELTQMSYQAHCACVQAVMYGVNLQGILPEDVRTSQVVIGSERPGVLRPLMERDGTVAVLRTMPVGRLDDAIWQARYTAYFVTYFNRDPMAFKTVLLPQNPNHDDFVWPYSQLDYALQPWVEAGKLFWLNPAQQLEAQLPSEVLALTGLTGRWRIKYGRVSLIPEHISHSDTYHSNGPAWKRIEEQTIQALKERQLKPLAKN